jgi:DNA polymerase III subunit gamma/tau
MRQLPEITAGGTVDVIEIDAASNRGINEMRELRENVRYQPARDRYKVFIIDEAHQITNEAFNALLKTIEEPPEWVVFVLCTTEAHKIPATIASRCQHFSFRSVDFEDLIARMAWICEQEGIEADQEALAVLAAAGEGSVRDSLSALDQAIACCGSKLDAAEVRALLGAFSLESLEQVSQALLDGDSGACSKWSTNWSATASTCSISPRARALFPQSAGAAHFRRGAAPGGRLRAAARKAGRHRRAFSEEDLTRYLQLSLDLFRDLQFSLQPRFHLEIGLLRLVQAGRLLPIEEALARVRGAGARHPSGSAPPAPQHPPLPRGRAATARADRRPSSSIAPRKPRAPARAAIVRRQCLRPAREAPPPMAAGDPRERLHSYLHEKGLTHLADAVENATIR